MIKVFKIKGLVNWDSGMKIEQEVEKIDGVDTASVSFFNQKLLIDYQDTEYSRIVEEIIKVCKTIESDCEIVLNT